MVVNIGDSHTPGSWMVSSVCGWGAGVTGAMGEVVGYSGALRGWCAWVMFTKQSRLQGLGVQPPGGPRPRRACSSEGRGLQASILGVSSTREPEADGGSLKCSHLRRRVGWVPVHPGWTRREHRAGVVGKLGVISMPHRAALRPGHVWDARHMVLPITWVSRCSHVQLFILECQGTLTTTSHGASKTRATNM